MDTLSSSVTTFQVPIPFHHHLKPTHVTHLPPTAASGKTTATSSKPPPSTHFPQKDNFTPLNARYPRKAPSLLVPVNLTLNPPRSSVHRKAASGYAAALLDIAQCNGAVLKVERHVRRLLRLLGEGQIRDFMKGEGVEEREKGEVVKELVEKGKFEGHLVRLVKMVLEKGKRVDMVMEVLVEFQRIFVELSGLSASYNGHGALKMNI